MSVCAEPKIYKNLTPEVLLEEALKNQEGVIAKTGAFVVETGARTGRSPKDRFIVKDALTDTRVDWGKVNQPIERLVFDALWQKASKHLDGLERSYESDLQVGADARYGVAVTVRTELAWHNLFTQHLFIGVESNPLESSESWVIYNAATLHTDPAIDGTASDGAVMIDMTQKKILVCGILYAGEMKKAMFTVLNFLLTDQDVLPMHCAANINQEGVVSLFFGLSGTGKTTLSADHHCSLIGDDEHGWSPDGVFNFEGGCYAKTIGLSEKKEPEIYHAVGQSGAVLENVILDSSGWPDYDNAKLTQNTRGAYSRSYLSRCEPDNYAASPSVVIFLACDCYGVLPPIAMLTKEQASYYFLSGYTALVGSTEVGSSSAIQPTFSTCFGAPFFPRPAKVYADLLTKRITETGAQVYLINTGWTGGAYGQGGHRFEISVTRQMVAAAQSGQLLQSTMKPMVGFSLMVPESLQGVDDKLLLPEQTWSDVHAYQSQANQLIQMFQDNFNRFAVDASIKAAGPTRIE